MNRKVEKKHYPFNDQMMVGGDCLNWVRSEQIEVGDLVDLSELAEGDHQEYIAALKNQDVHLSKSGAVLMICLIHSGVSSADISELTDTGVKSDKVWKKHYQAILNHPEIDPEDLEFMKMDSETQLSPVDKFVAPKSQGTRKKPVARVNLLKAIGRHKK